MERVQKLLSHAGYCSRREGEDLIEEGKVRVNGKKITLGDKATRKDKIEVDGEEVTFDPLRYIAFHKPKNILVSTDDPSDKDLIMDFFEDFEERIYPVGRLDYDARGLIFLTNDGDFANKVMHPRYEVEKTYQVLLDKEFDKSHVMKLSQGITLDDGSVDVDNVTVLDDKVVEITVHEGRNKLVKRIFKDLGYWVEGLVRTNIGSVRLGNLLPGEWRELSEEEISYFKKK